MSIQLPTSIHEEMQETEGVRLLKAKGHGLKDERIELLAHDALQYHANGTAG